VEIRIRLFAIARERAKASSITIELASGARVADLRLELARSVPELAPLIPGSFLAVDEEYADDSVLIQEDSEIALIPPVSGGLGLGQAEREVPGLKDEKRGRLGDD